MVRIEVFSLGDFHSIGSLEMISCHDVIDIVDSSRSESDFGKISGPNSPVCIFGLVLGEIRSIDVIVDISLL